MNDSFHSHTSIFPGSQKKLWPSLKPVHQLGFVLHGGTAIVLRLGHRQSVDFDFFTEHTLEKPPLLLALPYLSAATILQDTPDTLTALVPVDGENVKLSFFGSIDFGRVGIPQWTSDQVCLVASADDLFAHKLKTILQRIEAKDYVDIVALLQSGQHLETGLAGARALFGKSFQPAEALKALVYFEGGDLKTLTDEQRNTLIRAAGQIRRIPVVAKLSHSLL